MKITFISTVYNEEKSIDNFLSSLKKQSKQPGEIIISDGGSSDKTLEKLKQFQKDSMVPVKILIKNGNRSIGRNLAIKHATGDIIVCSDAGCILDKNWLKKITEPFTEKKVDVVSGFYLPKVQNTFERCLATYTCVMPDKINAQTFLPSSRSVAFKKTAWSKVNGYPEDLNTCEDLVFARELKRNGFQTIFTDKAIVYWPQRKNVLEAFKQFFSYAVGDGQALFIRKQIPFLFLRYLIGLAIVIIALITKSFILTCTLILGLILYIIWAINKNYRYVKEINAVFWLPLLQFTADFAVIIGTTVGILTRKKGNALNNIAIILFASMMIMLVIRSGIFTDRLIKEIKTTKNMKQNNEFLPAIQPCKQRKYVLNAEEQHMLNYRSLGIKCKK